MAFLNKGSADVIPRAEAPQTRNLPLPTLLGKPKFEPTRDFHPRRFSSSTESSPPPSIPSNPVPQSVRQTDISRRCRAHGGQGGGRNSVARIRPLSRSLGTTDQAGTWRGPYDEDYGGVTNTQPVGSAGRLKVPAALRSSFLQSDLFVL